MPGRLPHCRCLNSSLLRPNGAANGRKDHRQQQALFILMAPAQQQARGNYSRPPRQKPQQGAQPAVGLRADKYRRWAICSANNANGAVGLCSPCLHPVFQLIPKLAHDLPCLSFVVWPLHVFCSWAIPHNSKCRYGERGAADAKPKAQIILDAAKVSAASGGNSEPKQGQRSQSARGFCPRSTMRVPQPDIIEHFGNADAVPQLPERCLSRKAGIVRCCPWFSDTP